MLYLDNWLFILVICHIYWKHTHILLFSTEASNVSADFNTILETATPPATPIKEEYDDDDENTVIMPGVTINLLPSCNELNEKSNLDMNTSQPQKQRTTSDNATDDVICMAKKVSSN